MALLPEPPRDLGGASRAFYDELLRMLEVVAPARVDPRRCAARFEPGRVEVELVHADRDDWTIWALVGEEDAIAGAGGAHEHFFPPGRDELQERPWTTEIVDFVAELLRGEIEIRTTFRGESPITVTHCNRDESGNQGLVVSTAYLTPARLLVWRPKRTEIERLSFL